MVAPRRAVVIGVNNYEDKDNIKPLTGALNDAEEVYKRLRESGDFHIPESHFLRNDEATCRNIRLALHDLFWKDEPGEVSLFYFSGHGFQDIYRNGYIAPYDIKRDQPFVLGIRAEELREVVRVAAKRTAEPNKRENIVVILDCCYAGAATDDQSKGDKPAEDPDLEKWYSAPKGEADGGGWTILASSGKDEKSREKMDCCHELDDQCEHPHGAFTYHMLEGLDGKAGDGRVITLADLQNYVSCQLQISKLPSLRFSGAGCNQAGSVVIATATPRQDINKQLEQIEQYLQRDKPKSIFRAAKCLGKVIDKLPRLPKAIDLKAKIDTKLLLYRDPANKWVLTNRNEVGDDFGEIFGFLESAVAVRGRLTVDFIRRQTDLKQSLLTGLCEVGLGMLPNDTFVGQLSAASQPTLAAASDTPLAGKN